MLADDINLKIVIYMSSLVQSVNQLIVVIYYSMNAVVGKRIFCVSFCSFPEFSEY